LGRFKVYVGESGWWKSMEGLRRLQNSSFLGDHLLLFQDQKIANSTDMKLMENSEAIQAETLVQ
jgi:hypothetical protein